MNQHSCLRSVPINFGLLITLWLCGCAHVEVYQKPGAEVSALRSIAVLPFTPPPGLDTERVKGISEGVCDIVGAALMRQGFNVVERARVEAIFKERNLNLSELPTGNELEELARTLGADAFATGSVTEWREVGGFFKDGAVGLTIKIYDARTSEQVYAGSASKPFDIFDNPSVTRHAQELAQKMCEKFSKR